MTKPLPPDTQAALAAIIAAPGPWHRRLTSLDPALAAALPAGRGASAALYLERASAGSTAPVVTRAARPGTTRLIRRAVLAWLDALRETADATNAACAVLSAMPDVATRTLWRVADHIWLATMAGRPDHGVSFHTRRGLLASILGATLLYQLDGRDRDQVACFLDRRLADTARIGRLRRRS